MSTVKALLFLCSPLWGPPALLYHLARICGDGLLFVLEGHGAALEVHSPLLRPLFCLLAIPLFPVVITLETALPVVLLSGGSLLRLVTGADEGSLWLRLPAGLAVLVLVPAWLPPVVLLWIARRLVWEMGVTPLARRIGGTSRRSSSRGRFGTFAALRNLHGRKATAGISVVTGLTVFGVATGVWVLVAVLSVMAGLESDLQEKILGANAHVVILGRAGPIEDWEQVAEMVRVVVGVKGVSPGFPGGVVLPNPT